MAVFGEARGASIDGKRAVAQVILNRAGFPHIVFGSRKDTSLIENIRWVVLRNVRGIYQFSCFDPEDVNCKKLLRPDEYEPSAVWDECYGVAQESLAAVGTPDLLTQNSDHYFDESIQTPKWAKAEKKTITIGRLSFYRIYIPAISQVKP